MKPAFGSSLDPQLSRLIEQDFVPRFPKKPVRLPQFDSASLPAAADWTGCLIYVPNLGKVGLSDGATWTQTDGGPL